MENTVKNVNESTQENLQNTIKDLQGKIQGLNVDLITKQKELENINKPTITQDQLSVIHNAIGNFTDNLEFSSDDFDIELSMDYNNTVQIDRINLNSHGDLNDDIIRWIEKEFKVI